mgnify:CR=1 FL=1
MSYDEQPDPLEDCYNACDRYKRRIARLEEALKACKLSMFKSPEPFDPGDIEIRNHAIKLVNECKV